MMPRLYMQITDSENQCVLCHGKLQSKQMVIKFLMRVGRKEEFEFIHQSCLKEMDGDGATEKTKEGNYG